MLGFGRLTLDGRLHALATRYTLTAPPGFAVETRISGERDVFPLLKPPPRQVIVDGENLHMDMADADAVLALHNGWVKFTGVFPKLGPGGTDLVHARCFVEQMPSFQPLPGRIYTRYSFTITLL